MSTLIKRIEAIERMLPNDADVHHTIDITCRGSSELSPQFARLYQSEPVTEYHPGCTIKINFIDIGGALKK